MPPEGKVQITKRLINNKTKEKSKNALQEMTWDDRCNQFQKNSTQSIKANIFPCSVKYSIL